MADDLDESHEAFMARIRKMSSGAYRPTGEADAGISQQSAFNSATRVSQFRSRKAQVVRLYRNGMTDDEIARELNVSPADVAHARLAKLWV